VSIPMPPPELDPKGEIKQGFQSPIMFDGMSLFEQGGRGPVEITSPSGMRYGFSLELTTLDTERVVGYHTYTHRPYRGKVIVPDGMSTQVILERDGDTGHINVKPHS
jgi:hypothetical protein